MGEKALRDVLSRAGLVRESPKFSRKSIYIRAGFVWAEVRDT